MSAQPRDRIVMAFGGKWAGAGFPTLMGRHPRLRRRGCAGRTGRLSTLPGRRPGAAGAGTEMDRVLACAIAENGRYLWTQHPTQKGTLVKGCYGLRFTPLGRCHPRPREMESIA